MNNVSVPIDFRAQTESASQHALVMAKHTQSQVVLLNLLKDIGNTALDFDTNWVNVGSLKLAYARAIIEYASTTPTNLRAI